MAATVPVTEPNTIQAGNSLRFDRTLNDYPASEWTLTYVLRSRLPAVEKIEIVATPNGDAFEVNVPAATTLEWTPGDFTMVGYVAKSPDRYEVYRAPMTITPDIATADLPLDTRSYYERLLAKVRETIESGVVREVIRYNFNGVSTEVWNMADALKALAYLESKVEQEKAKASGKQRKILTRFVRPR